MIIRTCVSSSIAYDLGMSTPRTIVDLDREAIHVSIGVVERVVATDLDRPTPCAGWTLAALLAHMTAQHRGFAAAARGNVDDLSAWSVETVHQDPVTAYVDAAHDVLAAFAGADLDRQTLWLPEIRDGGPFPATMAVAFHLVDYVVHGWDVAVAIGAVATYPDEVLDAARTIAQLVPDDDERDQPGSAFAHTLPLTTDINALDEILLLLGRSPGWAPSER